MKKLLLLFIAMLLCISVYARIGYTLKQCDIKYGSAYEPFVDGDLSICYFHVDNYVLEITYVKNYPAAQGIRYIKIDPSSLPDELINHQVKTFNLFMQSGQYAICRLELSNHELNALLSYNGENWKSKSENPKILESNSGCLAFYDSKILWIVTTDLMNKIYKRAQKIDEKTQKILDKL